MRLNFRQYSDAGDPLIILHGLFGSYKNWNWHAQQFADKFAVYNLDLRNHGNSPHADSMTYKEMASDVLAFMDLQHISAAHLLGHSMGGKVAMQLALLQPDKCKRLLIVDIAPLAYPGDRGGHEDIFTALTSFDPASIASRADADKKMEELIPELPVRQFLLTNLERASEGGYRWRFNIEVLQSSYSLLRLGVVGDNGESGITCDLQTLFVKGAESNYIRDKDKEKISAIFPNAAFTAIDGAGHWVHSEKPKEFQVIARRFLIDGEVD